MSSKSIEFLKYLNLSQNSDAFIFIDKLESFIEVKLSQEFSNNILDFDKYTAGNTKNPDDYKLPSVENIVNPEKLIRINPFNNSKNTEVKIFQYGEEKYFLKNNQKNIPDEIIASDSLKFLFEFKKKTNERKIFSNEIELNKYNFLEEKLVLNPRYNDESSNNIPIEYATKNIDSKDKDNKEIINNETIKNIQNINRTKNIINDIEYDINNLSSSYFNDFTTINNTSKVVNEVKNEIINTVNQNIVNLEKKILSQTVSNFEMNNIQNNIVKNIQNHLDQKESAILEKIDEKSKKDLNKFKNDFLNS